MRAFIRRSVRAFLHIEVTQLGAGRALPTEPETIDQGQPDLFVIQIFYRDAMFQRAKIRARLPLPEQAQMRLRGLVYKPCMMGVGAAQLGLQPPGHGDPDAIDLHSCRQCLFLLVLPWRAVGSRKTD